MEDGEIIDEFEGRGGDPEEEDEDGDVCVYVRGDRTVDMGTGCFKERHG